MLTPLDSLILGAVQGVTEFLPVSSSGHLILMRELLGINTSGGLAFDAVLQLATIVAAFVYFRSDVRRLIQTAWHIVARHADKIDPAERVLLTAIIVGTIPAAIAGLLLEHTMETAFRSAQLVAVTLIAGSAIFIYAERRAKLSHVAPNVRDGWIIGLFQALALVPGVSRSGASISGGLLRGLTRESAARFSFLLSLPIITLSGLKKLYDLYRVAGVHADWQAIIIASIVAFCVGLASIHFLLGYLKRRTLMVFVWYRCTVGVIILFMYLILPFVIVSMK